MDEDDIPTDGGSKANQAREKLRTPLPLSLQPPRPTPVSPDHAPEAPIRADVEPSTVTANCLIGSAAWPEAWQCLHRFLQGANGPTKKYTGNAERQSAPTIGDGEPKKRAEKD